MTIAMQQGAESTLACDGYKLGHIYQYPDKTERVASNWTARGSRVSGQDWVVWFGPQHFVQKFVMEKWAAFFAGDIDAIVDDYADEVNSYLGVTSVTGAHLRDLHALGYLPLEFRWLPEGTRVPLRVPMLLVENTIHDERFSWLTNYFETMLSAELWGPSTSATTAIRFRELLEEYALLTGSPLEFVPWQGHDFSMRGMFGVDAAVLSGMGHLVAFTGTDTVPAIREVRKYYDMPRGSLIGGSVNATEHSVACSSTQENELTEYYERLLRKFPEGILSMVSDTWDLWRVLTEYLPALKDLILSRNGKLVIRPDSGDPVKIICGDPDAPTGSPAYKGVVELLWEVFGGTTTPTGHKLLDGHIGVIYGDGISYERADAILNGLWTKGFASANMVFGLGSYTYQYVTRDTYNFAMKATWVQVAGEGRAIFKNPITDNGMKKSATGRLAVLRDEYETLYAVENATPEQEAASELRPMWRDGQFLVRTTFEEIRQRALAEIASALA